MDPESEVLGSRRESCGDDAARTEMAISLVQAARLDHRPKGGGRASEDEEKEMLEGCRPVQGLAQESMKEAGRTSGPD